MMARYRAAMQRKSNVAAIYAASTATLLAGEIAACWLFIRWMQENWTWLEVGIAFLILIAIQIGLTVVHFITGWISFALFMRNMAARGLAQAMHGDSLPRPEPGESSVYEFASRLRDDEGQPIEIRLKAAHFLGALPAPGSFSGAVRAQMIGETALRIYRAEYF